MLGLSSVFGKASNLPGFTADDFRTFIVPLGFLQGAGFTGAATGVNLARDIEQGWFDRLLLCPTPRAALLAGVVASAGLRALLPGTFLFIVAIILGVGCAELACPGADDRPRDGLRERDRLLRVTLALRFRTQQAAPLMQIASFISVLFTTSYAPKPLLSDWLHTIADINPVTLLLEGVRQGFVTEVTWSTTWPALVATAGMVGVLGAFAVRGLRRYGI